MKNENIIIRGVCGRNGKPINLDQWLVIFASDFVKDFYSQPPKQRTKENLVGYFHNFFEANMKRLSHSGYELFSVEDNDHAFMAKLTRWPVEKRKKFYEAIDKLVDMHND